MKLSRFDRMGQKTSRVRTISAQKFGAPASAPVNDQLLRRKPIKHSPVTVNNHQQLAGTNKSEENNNYKSTYEARNQKPIKLQVNPTLSKSTSDLVKNDAKHSFLHCRRGNQKPTAKSAQAHLNQLSQDEDSVCAIDKTRPTMLAARKQNSIGTVYRSPSQRPGGQIAKSLNRSASFGNLTVQSALNKVASDDWEDKVNGLKELDQLATSKPKEILSELHAVVECVVLEAKNLRSSVSRQAIQTLGSICQSVQRNLDSEAEKVIEVLMAKTGDTSNAFIRDDSVKSLKNLVENISPSRSCAFLIAAGAHSKAVQIRTACATLLLRLVNHVGPSRVMQQRDLADKIIPQAIAFSRDPQPNPRQMGRNILLALAKDRETFNKNVSKICTDSDARYVYSIVDKGK